MSLTTFQSSEETGLMWKDSEDNTATDVVLQRASRFV